MPRKPGTVLVEKYNSSSNKVNKILKSDGIWAVYYDNSPFNLRSESHSNFTPPRYKTVSFSNSGHAINLAKKLNKEFNTDLFTVVLLTDGKTVYPK